MSDNAEPNFIAISEAGFEERSRDSDITRITVVRPLPGGLDLLPVVSKASDTTEVPLAATGAAAAMPEAPPALEIFKPPVTALPAVSSITIETICA